MARRACRNCNGRWASANPSLSQHLARLRKDKLVKTHRESQAIYYSLATADVCEAHRLLAEIFCGGDGKRVKLGTFKRIGAEKASCSFLSLLEDKKHEHRPDRYGFRGRHDPA